MSDDTTRPARGQKMKLGKAKASARAAPNSAARPKASATPAQAAPIKPAPARKPKDPERKPKGPERESRVSADQGNRPARSRRDAPAPARMGRPAFQEAHQSRPRVFFALKVPAEVAAPLGEAQKALRGNWRPVRPEQFHVTLVYLPGVDPGRIDDLKRLGTRLAQNLAPLDVRLRGTGYFPNEGSPRVWFVKVEGEGLDELAAALRAECQALGLETEETNFRAHITLARKKGPAPRVAPKIFELGWQAPQLVLYRSHLQKTGPIYEVLSTFKFRL